MASEVRRGATRILANYARLFATVTIGLVLVPVQLAWLGNDGFGLLALVGASVGLAAILQDVMRNSLVRELGTAWHADQRDIPFATVYASAFVICGVIALATAAFFVLAIVVIPLLDVPPDYIAPARWILGAEGVSSCVLILLSPAFNMYVVDERFIAHNIWTAAQRAVYLLAALVLFLGFRITDPPLGLTLFGISTAAMSILLLLIATAIIIGSDSRLRPKPWLFSRPAIREVSATFGWNSGVVLAMNLHERVGAIIMNVVFGLWGNAIFGLALRLVGYVRMTTLGVTFGLDAVSTRLSSVEDHGALRSVIRHSTRLHGYVAIPAAIFVLLMAEPLLRLWVGRYVQDPDPESGRAVVASAEVLVKIMVVGLAARAIADGWTKLLYGAGHIRTYAPLVLAGGLANPVIAFALIWLLPKSTNYTAAAWGLSAVFVVVHLVLLPAAGAKALGTSWQDLLAPLIRPTLVTLGALPVLLVPLLRNRAAPIGWTEFLLITLIFGATYFALGYVFGLRPAERIRLRRLVGVG